MYRSTWVRWVVEFQTQGCKISLILKFKYSEKATKFCEIFPLLLTVCTVVKSKGKISPNFVAFSEYMNFNKNFFGEKFKIPGGKS